MVAIQFLIFSSFLASFVQCDIPSIFDRSNVLLSLYPPKDLAPGILHNESIPTNKWWGNLISTDPDVASFPVYPNPFRLENQLRKAPYGLSVAYPYDTRSFGPLDENNAVKSYEHNLEIIDIQFSASEFSESKPVVTVSDWTDLGVKSTFTSFSSPSSSMESYLVSGSAYITMEYKNLRPLLTSTHSIVSINGENINKGTFTGEKFIIELSNSQKWVVYALKPISFNIQSATQLIATTSNYFGTLRVALLSSKKNNNNDLLTADYDKYKTCIVTGGNAKPISENQYNIDFDLAGDCPNGFLHFTLPHQQDLLTSASGKYISSVELYAPTRGLMKGFVSSNSKSWIFTESISETDASFIDNIDFYPPTKISSADVISSNLLELLKNDINTNYQFTLDGSYYFNGKLLQKVANLCLMAADPVVVGTDNTILLSTCLKKLENMMNLFLDNKAWKYPLVYDEVYRGIISSQYYKTGNDIPDFGNAYYNDHHYHYGYWLVSGAILKYLNPQYERMNDLTTMMNILIDDVINPTKSDLFPLFRLFDWYRGHSYSHGITGVPDGKDEESTSEEVNFLYGLILWGKMTKSITNYNQLSLSSLGKLMLKVNKRTVQKYFLMSSDNVVHPKSFLPNKVTGIFFDNRVLYDTWFNPARECIHGIQMIPVSPMNDYLRGKKFIIEEWDQVLSTLPLVQNVQGHLSTWQSLLFANYAIVNKKIAMDNLAIVPMDDGLSRSWAIYFAASH